MAAEEARRRSRFMMRVMEWSDPRARYPNLWHEGMPLQLLAFDSVVSRLRLYDLIAVYSPASPKHPERSMRFVGLARVMGLRRAQHDPSLAWVDLETAHRFDPPLDLGEEPRRVFLCCDPGWPEREVALFRRVFVAAVRAGWRPTREEQEEFSPHPEEPAAERVVTVIASVATEGTTHGAAAVLEVVEAPPAPAAERSRSTRTEPRGRVFGGVDYSGDMRDPKDATWLALVELGPTERLRVLRLEPTGRVGLEARLRDADGDLLRAEAFGLDFPFGLPLAFAESLLGGPFPDEGWWALARRLERMSRPEYLIALQDFRDANGELKRFTDEQARAFSPLHRVHPDLGPMTYHGIRMIAEERSRYAVRPFETARGRLLLEVYPGGSLRRLRAGGEDEPKEGERGSEVLSMLRRIDRFPVDVDEPFRRRCAEKRDALDAVLAARCAALAVLTGEVDSSLDDLAPGHADQVRREGWIYGLS